MRKFSYWHAQHLTDVPAYNVRAKTKREALALKREIGPQEYGPVEKVTVEYRDTFDLIEKCLGEGGGYWEGLTPPYRDEE